MKKYLIIATIGLMAVINAKAQEYKLKKSSGKLVINLSSVTVEGYGGSEIVFTSQHKDDQVDERAKGLQMINGSGFTDNTGLGINVAEKGGNIEVNQVGSKDEAIKIMIPRGVSISYAYSKVSHFGKAVFTNIESEIEVAVTYNPVKLDNVTGPVTVNAIYGTVDAIFKGAIKGPISIVSIYSAVDVTIPGTTKANLKLKSTHDGIFAAAELKIELEKTTTDDMVNYGSDIKGKINGGGIDISLKSEYRKIYLRNSK